MAAQGRLRCFEYLYFIPLFLVITTLSVTALISFVIFVIVYLISGFFPYFGNFLNVLDVLFDEEFEDSSPQQSLVVSLTLQGNISLDELKFIFTKNVLSSRSKVNPSKFRYPNLKQYLATFICFRIWKIDPDFHVKNHIIEKVRSETDLGNIHQEYLQKPFQKQRSPWELTLIRNVFVDNKSEKEPLSILVLRIHHVMADAKSLLKLLVECLGNKPVKTASPQFIQETSWDYLKFILRAPYNYFSDNVRIIRLAQQSFDHPWKMPRGFKKPTCQTVVAFSSKISLSTLKHVEKQNCVQTSAVVMSIIAGAIRHVCRQSCDKKVIVAYVLPKQNHPEQLTNHASLSFVALPTDQQCELKRLLQCNQEFIQMKNEQRGRYIEMGCWFIGFQIYPLTRLFCNTFTPIGITNNAGDEEGFTIGDTRCIDYRLSGAPMSGSIGVTICTMSYKNEMRIAVTAKEPVLSRGNAEIMAKRIETELQILLKPTK